MGSLARSLVYEEQANPPPPTSPQKHIGTFKARSHFDNTCMMGKHQFGQVMLSGDSSCCHSFDHEAEVKMELLPRSVSIHLY